MQGRAGVAWMADLSNPREKWRRSQRAEGRPGMTTPARLRRFPFWPRSAQLSSAGACRGRIRRGILPGQAGAVLHHGQPGRRLRYLYACAHPASGEEARRQDAADQRTRRRRADRDEPHAQRAARRPDDRADRRRDAGDGAALRVAGGQLRRPQARLAGAGEQRVEGRAARAEVALQRRRRHGEERKARDLCRLRQDRRQFRFHRHSWPTRSA